MVFSQDIVIGQGTGVNRNANATCSDEQLDKLRTPTAPQLGTVLQAPSATRILSIKLVNVCGISPSTDGTPNKVDLLIDGEIVTSVNIPPESTGLLVAENIDFVGTNLEVKIIAGNPDGGNDIDNFLLGGIEIVADSVITQIAP